MNFAAESISGLCCSQTVRLLRQYNTVVAMAEDGQLMWVFDISSSATGKRGHTRELRFYFPEVVTPQFCARLTLREVIDKILPPTRKFFASGEICQLLLISRQTLGRIAREMGAELHNRVFRVSRAAFAAWLEARWIGGRA
ncbi:MAG TPA: hypothetical protein VN873_05000 [Candidatus Angelobacter sp.]|nr:hypothetical protein [Candidatus Angelobacter sp.]